MKSSKKSMSQYPLFETFALMNGKFANLSFHQERLNETFRGFFLKECPFYLRDLQIPSIYQQGFFRCRMDYNATHFHLRFSAYTPKTIRTFQCVETKNLDYQFKYSDRKRLDCLNNLQTDEIIIINNGFVSDCTIGNLLFLKQMKWYSPQHYLLKGTQLRALLAEQQVTLVPITKSDLFEYEKMMVINALNPFDSTKAIPIDPTTVLI